MLIILCQTKRIISLVLPLVKISHDHAEVSVWFSHHSKAEMQKIITVYVLF